MRNSILGFRQDLLISIRKEKEVKDKDNKVRTVVLTLDMTDILLMDYIQRALSQPSMIKLSEDNQPYVWLYHKKILQDLPILNIGEEMLKKRLAKLVELDLIKFKLCANEKNRGSRSYYTITEFFESLQMFESEQSPSVKNYTWSSEPSVKNYTSNNLVNTDNKSNTISKDKVLDNTNSASKSNFLRSATKQSKPNLYDRCVSHIKMFTEDKELQEQLIVFLDSLCEMQKLKGENQFKGILKKLSGCSVKDQLDMVSYSIEKGYATFYPLDKNTRGKTGSAVIDIEGFDSVKVHGSNKEYKAKMMQEIENGSAEKF